MSRNTLHEKIIDRACRDEGWKRGNWKVALRAKLREEPWVHEAEEMLGDILEIRRTPDAYRIIVEGPSDDQDFKPDVINEEWGYSVLVLEFLEVEIGHPMPLEKRRDYTGLWWRFDASDLCHLRVYIAERYGPIKLWLDTDTIYQETALH